VLWQNRGVGSGAADQQDAIVRRDVAEAPLMTDDRVRDELLLMERRIMDAIRARETSALRGMLAEGFVYRNPAAADVRADGFLDGVSSLPVAILSLIGERVEAAVFGDTGIVTGVQVAVTREGDDGPPQTSRSAFTDVFVRAAGTWRLALAHAVDLPHADG
jgi:ketosteroid isomerase-like protein